MIDSSSISREWYRRNTPGKDVPAGKLAGLVGIQEVE